GAATQDYSCAYLLALKARFMPTSQLPVRRQGFAQQQGVQRGKMPVENFPAVVSHADRTPRREAPDRFAHQASARTIHALLSFDRGGASRQPTRKSMEEKHLHAPVIRPRRTPVADNARPSHLPSARVQWPRWYCGHVRLLQAETQRV